ncbi:hypothetical protein [Sphingosinicella soli]|uniref:Uncharacterized protein n=1 Tax=Sphingosinicella soli TaxID=333708 RepID=A0A7W7B4V2_9SPHN|nr:hypothetical protein [Sphingosinicella soli]MBB4633970.1 hypothetical protein [Sphingosinicella soli]
MNSDSTTARIEALVTRLGGAPICDACVTLRLALKPGSKADAALRGLAGRGGFERRRGTCALCDTETAVSVHGAG